jgi:hypothetical protein
MVPARHAGAAQYRTSNDAASLAHDAEKLQTLVTPQPADTRYFKAAQKPN